MSGLVRCANPACSSMVDAARTQSTGGLCSLCEKYGASHPRRDSAAKLERKIVRPQ